MDITAENRDLFESLMAVIRSSSQLYAQDVGFIRTLDKSLRTSSEHESARILDLVNGLITSATGDKSKISSVADLEKSWPAVESTFDFLFDRVNSLLAPGASQQPSQTPSQLPSRDQTPDVVYHNRSLDKPQNQFPAGEVDNSVGPFKPRLIAKPHAKTDLVESTKVQPADDEHKDQWYTQPYQQEIQDAKYPKFVYEPAEPIPPRPWDESEATYVDTPAKLHAMVKKLLKAKVIAVDLEHHDLRSYLGLVCLMQISTTKEDWIVDPFALRTELQVLNEVFCDPHIVKVFHGAYMDIHWLQRDLGLYVVNLFDTYHAARALGLPRHSLAYLLETIAHFTPSKQYQRADWRVRPLSPELLDYARADTHFLLYIYQTLCNRLIESHKLDTVLDESRRTALKRYEKPGWNEEPGWHRLSLKSHLNPAQNGVLARLYEWRDKVARDNDESPNYVMANHYLTSLAVLQPKTAAGVMALSHHISNFVREDAEKIAKIIASTDEELKIPLTKTAPASSTADLFSRNVLSNAASLRLDDPKIYGQDPPTKPAPKKIYLGLFKMDEIPSPPRPPPPYESPEPSPEPQATETATKAEATEPKSKSEAESGAESSAESDPVEMVPKKDKSRKRKIRVVDNMEELNEQPAKPARSSKKLEDEDAFDFAGAKKVLKESADISNKFRVGNQGPRGARARHVPGGGSKSKTFRK